VSDALFRPTDDDLVIEATELTRGPWDPGAQHGGAPAALLGRAVEAVQPGGDMRVARMTLELLRPVPITRLRVETELVRPGRRVQLVAARLYGADDDVLVLQALALRIRRDATTGAPAVVSTATAPPLPGPDAAAVLGSATPGLRSFPDDGVELRFASGHYRDPGPATVWIRLNVPVVPGEEPSALSRVLAAADFGNGVSAVLDWDRFVFINPDLSVHLEREAEGEWICLEAETTIGADGTGQAVSTLYDQRGRIGRSVQGLFVDERPR
jgi:acyl-coenzyme A thioesterase PaaI-like protein